MWQGNNNSFYFFNKDGTWSWDSDGQKILLNPENQGRWWIEGDVIHIQDLSGLAPCPKEQIGAYQAMLTGDSLAMAAVSDPCQPRIASPRRGLPLGRSNRIPFSYDCSIWWEVFSAGTPGPPAVTISSLR
jgi:hypothetical protein